MQLVWTSQLLNPFRKTLPYLDGVSDYTSLLVVFSQLQTMYCNQLIYNLQHREWIDSKGEGILRDGLAELALEPNRRACFRVA